MDWLAATESWWGRFALTRGIAAIYLVAFLCAALQFRGLLGSNGMTPIPKFLARSSFRAKPSIFHWHYTDRFFAAVCWAGAAVSAALVLGLGDAVPLWAAMLLWFGLWVAYLSIVNVGQCWYSFGWESLLLEAGFLAVFLGNDETAPPLLVLLLARWLLFRLEFGAGLIKIRGDRCWRDLTCLYYHHETQPMPGPLSWFFHRLPKPLHRVEVLGNHITQLIVPFGLFAPQPVAGIAATIMIVTQLWLVASGNFAWLNWLTIVLACSVLDDTMFAAVLGVTTPAHAPTSVPTWFGVLVLGFTALVLVLSWRPALNLFSPHQRMNSTFDPLHLVNAYGAFGSVGKTRYEVVIEGTADTVISPHTEWREYGFKGKPGDPARMPRQWAPYHLRLDWLMWFAALSSSYARPWIGQLLKGLLSNNRDIVKLLGHNPFPDQPPTHVRALLYEYRFTTGKELLGDRVWWHRELIGDYLPPVDADRVRRFVS